ncbi:RagB/SusD family nutrient uptake outer membrane protein [Sphingobacterium sp. UT-1RO-CII-1]|uniref:RagB/SusD family nutrient uptake outer membrane protein n=1 Tax=Sphingobacterium sp. UT-1RO-CII-1 TaxID=2995225 RepID=UPI00227C33D2|nr:RagB/SusD family nutrient uptake outer membrane protein [Sphingobacterium sp. UT-1RO-CII-1]MCY4780022.1 RagB/SusD family nutrient uptake outer membrane protein [Sphingobacterium sp. UT-1RO-CII-1]
MKKIFRNYVFLILSFFSLFIACESFLNEKPDRSLALPDGVKELEAILDYNLGMNQNTPAAGDIASTYFYLTEADFSARTQTTREIYCWDSEVNNIQDWQNSYNRIFYANVVLDEIDAADLGSKTEADRQRVKGAALFFRGWDFYQIAQIYAEPYEKESSQKLGIPLRLEADINVVTVRSTLQETYDQVLKDLTAAAIMLPDKSSIATRPSKAAAYAALAIVHLDMRHFEKAEKYADSCLALHDELIDYNNIDAALNNPFPIFNKEVIYHSTMFGTSLVFTQNRARVNPDLFNTYADNDLRKNIFFKQNANDAINFKGDYSGGVTGSPFSGLAVDEVYLIKAECAARVNKVDVALTFLNRLLEKRYDKDSFEPYHAIKTEEIIDKVIAERKKELAFRAGISWRDLRRLNKEPRYQQTLVRKVGAESYMLKPNDKRYTFLIPISVVEISGVKQNER